MELRKRRKSSTENGHAQENGLTNLKGTGCPVNVARDNLLQPIGRNIRQSQGLERERKGKLFLFCRDYDKDPSQTWNLCY